MTEPVPQAPSAPAERHRRIILGVATVLVALPLLGLGWQLFRTPPPVPPVGSTLGMVARRTLREGQDDRSRPT